MDAIGPILSGIDWNGVLKTIGSTAVVVAILGFLAKVIIEHFLRRDVETLKADLRREADRELTDAKARSDAALLAQKVAFDRQIEAFRNELATKTARADRIRQEVTRWANPILGAVMELSRRLDIILNESGHLVLSPTPRATIHRDWSIDYEYFFPSTIFLFSQYFCWVRLLEEQLSFELFEKHADKDVFYGKVQAVRRTLSSFPLPELGELSGIGDAQVFSMQQRAIGETLAVNQGESIRCMRFSEFTHEWHKPDFRSRFDPLIRFVHGLEPAQSCRWRRVELMAEALRQLRSECQRLLSITSATLSTADVERFRSG